MHNTELHTGGCILFSLLLAPQSSWLLASLFVILRSISPFIKLIVSGSSEKEPMTSYPCLNSNCSCIVTPSCPDWEQDLCIPAAEQAAPHCKILRWTSEPSGQESPIDFPQSKKIMDKIPTHIDWGQKRFTLRLFPMLKYLNCIQGDIAGIETMSKQKVQYRIFPLFCQWSKYFEFWSISGFTSLHWDIQPVCLQPEYHSLLQCSMSLKFWWTICLCNILPWSLTNLKESILNLLGLLSCSPDSDIGPCPPQRGGDTAPERLHSSQPRAPWDTAYKPDPKSQPNIDRQ